jgi:hypothetical protein
MRRKGKIAISSVSEKIRRTATNGGFCCFGRSDLITVTDAYFVVRISYIV